jgi:hypothetical protein
MPHNGDVAHQGNYLYPIVQLTSAAHAVLPPAADKNG